VSTYPASVSGPCAGRFRCGNSEAADVRAAREHAPKNGNQQYVHVHGFGVRGTEVLVEPALDLRFERSVAHAVSVHPFGCCDPNPAQVVPVEFGVSGPGAEEGAVEPLGFVPAVLLENLKRAVVVHRCDDVTLEKCRKVHQVILLQQRQGNGWLRPAGVRLALPQRSRHSRERTRPLGHRPAGRRTVGRWHGKLTGEVVEGQHPVRGEVTGQFDPAFLPDLFATHRDQRAVFGLAGAVQFQLSVLVPRVTESEEAAAALANELVSSGPGFVGVSDRNPESPVTVCDGASKLDPGRSPLLVGGDPAHKQAGQCHSRRCLNDLPRLWRNIQSLDHGRAFPLRAGRGAGSDERRSCSAM
jgi:hypothetical protein